MVIRQHMADGCCDWSVAVINPPVGIAILHQNGGINRDKLIKLIYIYVHYQI